MTALQLIQALNSALAFGVNGITTAQKIGRVLEDVQREGRDVSADEWADIVAEVDAADANLAAALNNTGA